MLPIQIIKLDRAFVRDIETDANDAAISAATLALAHSLGLKVVAEGVETEAQRDFLVDHGCDYLQGYLFGKPEPAQFWSERWKNILPNQEFQFARKIAMIHRMIFNRFFLHRKEARHLSSEKQEL